VLGASGMLGHKLCQRWSDRYDCLGTVRSEPSAPLASLLGADRLIGDVAADRVDRVTAVVEDVRPDVVVNCIGIVKQSAEASDPIRSITINALFPHRLAEVCGSMGVRLIQISTDCVFSGRRGGYREDDLPDPLDLYGRSKLLGEPSTAGALTLRTSIIGRELTGANGLLEWLLSNEGGEVRGFTRAIFSGLTTEAVADEVGFLIDERPRLSGIRHLSADPIDKYDLLGMLRDGLGLDLTVVPDDELAIDRSLNSELLRSETGRERPSWPTMVSRLAEDNTPYEEIRGSLA
jgi:dTDP-4-dehydrorhamnose reductase